MKADLIVFVIIVIALVWAATLKPADQNPVCDTQHCVGEFPQGAGPVEADHYKGDR